MIELSFVLFCLQTVLWSLIPIDLDPVIHRLLRRYNDPASTIDDLGLSPNFSFQMFSI